MRRSLLLAALLAFTLASSLALQAQDPPPTGDVPHAPQPEATPAAVGSAEVKGPNLQPPLWLTGAQRAQLESAVALWDQAYALVRARGSVHAKPKLDEAIAALRAAREIDARLAIPDHYLGIAYQLTGDFEQAVLRLKDATKKHPRFHEALVELGDAQRWAGKLEDSERSYGQALEVAPTYVLALRMRSELRIQRGQLAQARDDARAGLALQPLDLTLGAIDKRLTMVLDGPTWPTKYTAETRNYIVWTNTDQALADQIAADAELIRRLYTQIFDRPPRAKRKSSIIVFATRAEYRLNGGPANAGGHFDPLFKQLFLFKYEKPTDTALVLFHEGFHQFLDQLLDDGIVAPQWFNEGLADFFGPAEHVTTGEEGMRIKSNPWRLNLVKQLIREGKALPWQRLMTMSQAEMYEPAKASQHYAQAWAICYFLCQADDRAHFGLLRDYFGALKKKKSLEECYQAAFGRVDMKGLEARWAEYMASVE